MRSLLKEEMKTISSGETVLGGLSHGFAMVLFVLLGLESPSQVLLV